MGGYSKSLKGRGMEKPDGVAPFASAIEEAPVGPERDYPPYKKEWRLSPPFLHSRFINSFTPAERLIPR
jgi:hypothetical protein